MSSGLSKRDLQKRKRFQNVFKFSYEEAYQHIESIDLSRASLNGLTELGVHGFLDELEEYGFDLTLMKGSSKYAEAT